MNKSLWSFRAANYVFIGYATYLTVLWIFINYGGRGSDPYSGSGFRWLLITGPLLFYILLNFLLLLFHPKIKKDPAVIFLLCYLLFVFTSSVFNTDLKHFSEAARWALPLMFIAHFRIRAPLLLVNGLFIFAILILVLTFNSSETDYGYLPGQTTVNLHQGMWWRVSIWKYLTPPYSAAFSILVFVANYFLNKGKSRFIFYAIAVYFVVLSGNRTSYLIFLICVSIFIAFDPKDFSYNKRYTVIPLCAVSVIFGLQLAADIIPLLGIQNEFFNSAILRNDSASGDAQNLSSRILIILEHIRLMETQGVRSIMGIGSQIYTSPQWTGNGGILGGTTDSYISHLIARDGIAVVFLSLSFTAFFIRAMKERNFLAYIVLLSLLLYTIGYGAWLNLTSPVFVLFLGFLYQSNEHVTKQVYS